MPIYVVKTEQFGNVLLDCTNIKQARKWAKQRFGVKHPGSVWRQHQYVRCPKCECKPCCCEGET